MYQFGLKIFLFILITGFHSAYIIAQKKPAKIQFRSSTMEVDKNLGNGAKRLIDNVVFTHGGAKMYCDSAYFYSEIQTLDAFGDVYINQGDTVHLYGRYLHYEGNTKIANVRKQVKLINRETTLTTEALDYNLDDGVGYYTNYAHIVNEENTLESIYGYYYTRTDWLHFRDSVIIINPDYKILSDTIRYQTKKKIAYFEGPTEIISDSNYIYCEKGWYDTKRDISQLNENAFVQNPTQIIKGDSLYYERKTGFGRAVNNVELHDLEQKVILLGNWGEYYENTDYAILTDSAQFIQITSEDSIYVHADTLKSLPDTSGEKMIKAYYQVRVFKTNLQARCDSMVYSFIDSTSRLYGEPVMWSENQQLTADYIEILTKNRQVDKMYLNGAAFIISQKDTVKYDQIKGKSMICHFRDQQLYRIEVFGNGETVYYPKDEEDIIGANKAVCSNIVIHFVDGQVDKIDLLVQPNATLHPLEIAPVGELLLKDFKWLDALRPKNRYDIFTRK